MIITKITRTYSRTINTKNYGAAESWPKIESTYEAVIESGDDPIKVSSQLAEQAQKDVADAVGVIINKIKGAVQPAGYVAPGTPAQSPATQLNPAPRQL